MIINIPFRHYRIELQTDEGLEVIETDLPESVDPQEVYEVIMKVLRKSQRTKLAKWSPSPDEMN